MISPKYKIITLITSTPPQVLIKNNNIIDNKNVINIVDNEIGHVCCKSAIASSKKLSPKSIVYAKASLLG